MCAKRFTTVALHLTTAARAPSAPRFWQKVVGCAINHGAVSVEVGVHRGLRADGVLGTVGFGLSAVPFPAG